MKKVITQVIILLVFNLTLGQIENKENKIRDYIPLEGFEMKGLYILPLYFSLKKNVDSKDILNKNEYIEVAKNLLSYSFMIHKGNKRFLFAVVNLNSIKQDSDINFSYGITNLSNSMRTRKPSKVLGEISEKRAYELLELSIDNQAKINVLPTKEKELFFNGMTYKIQSFEEIKNEVAELGLQLLKKPVKAEVLDYIEKETIDGHLDFNKLLEQKDQSFFLFEGVVYNKNDYAILIWGNSLRRLGIKSAKKAKNLWEKIHQNELNNFQAAALKKGVRMEKEHKYLNNWM